MTDDNYMTIEEELNAADFIDDDYTLSMFVHDQDSDRPMEIIDEEPELDQEDQMVVDAINKTIDALEELTEQETGTVQVPMNTIREALQLLKAFNCYYQLDYEQYSDTYE